MNLKFKKQNLKNGYVTLVLMIIVGTLTAGIVFTVMSDSINSSQIGLTFSQTYKARSYGNACAEKALYRIHNGDITASESNGITFDSNNHCTYDAVISGGNVTIDIEGVSGRANVTQNITGTLSSRNITIISWN
ncbi:hypothetical protein K8Q94_02665 [Candidatus Nomurabacteria bacterium]|nr:hypothetical protein [Candidatus Nomurabacteria bacterium]